MRAKEPYGSCRLTQGSKGLFVYVREKREREREPAAAAG